MKALLSSAVLIMGVCLLVFCGCRCFLGSDEHQQPGAQPRAYQRAATTKRIALGMPLSVVESILTDVGSSNYTKAIGRRFGGMGHFEGDPNAKETVNVWYVLPGKTLIAFAGKRLLREPDKEFIVTMIKLGETGRADDYFRRDPRDRRLEYLACEVIVSKEGLVEAEKVKSEYYRPTPATQKAED